MPVSSLSAGAFPAVAHSSSPEDHQGEWSFMQALHLDIPTISMGVGKHSMDISIIFCRMGRPPLKDLTKRILCILSIFILKYLPIFILMKAVSVPWEERNFLSISIFRVEFFAFLRVIFT